MLLQELESLPFPPLFSSSLFFPLSYSFSSREWITFLDRGRHMIGHHCPWGPWRSWTKDSSSTICHSALLSSSLFVLSARGWFALRKLRPLTRTLCASFSPSLSLFLSLSAAFCCIPFLSFVSHSSQYFTRADPLRALSAWRPFLRMTTNDDLIKMSQLNTIIINSSKTEINSKTRHYKIEKSEYFIMVWQLHDSKTCSCYIKRIRFKSIS